MKKFAINNLYTILLLIILLSFGCTKNLEEVPKSIIAPTTFYANDADFDAAINGAIRPLYSGSTHMYVTSLMCAGSEDVSSRPTAPELLMFDVFKPTTNYSFVLNFWTNYYQAINACNDLIANLPKAKVSESNKLLYEGQARYIRALSYFYLVRLFGEIPIVTTENVANSISLVQSPIPAVYDVIIADLMVAETNLPLTFSQKGRPTKGAAKALLAEVYLNMTGWPVKDATKYALARDKAKEVIDLNLYALEPNFADLWRVKNKLTTKEFIFMFNGSSSVTATGSSLHQRSRPSEEGGWNDFMSEVRFFNAFPAGPRKDASFWTVFADAKKTTWQNSSVGKPFIAKWRDAGAAATFEQGTVNNTGGGDGFWPVTRYSDVLLMYAEAANMAENGPSAAALEAINKVRRRAGGNNPAVYPDLPSGMSKQAFDDAVIAERNWELAFECKRWFDLVRREMVVSANIAVYPYVAEHNKLLPKPQIEVDLIPGLKQNAGYN